MADFNVAFDWVMGFEDPKREYATVNDAPPGAFAISGINSRAFPSDFQTISVLSMPQRVAAVQAFYELNFWNSWIAQLQSDELAKRVFDAGVNMGKDTAVKLLQQALGAAVVRDGAWGPITLQAANSANPDELVGAFKRARIGYYEVIAARNPDDAKYLDGWRVRASQ